MSFYADLKFGQDSEDRLLQKYPFLQLSSDRGYDFIIKGTNIKIEKKADSYDPKKYSNFIMERFSHTEKDGGPWQSKAHGVRYFMYWFVTTDTLYVFDLVQLLARLKKLIKKHDLKLHDRWNPGYTTRYYKVPISMLEDLNVGIERLESLHVQAVKKAAKKVKK